MKNKNSKASLSGNKKVPGTFLRCGASLFLGKAAARSAEVWTKDATTGPCLVITPRVSAASNHKPAKSIGRWVFAEHPLPGQGSFEAGGALLDFLDSLRRFNVKRLNVFLSGGASSLMWLPPATLSHQELYKKLKTLYTAPLSIFELNAERSKLCKLKGGGAAAFLKRLAPQVKVEVYVISDVYPFGPEVVGSGPFWDGRIRHHVLADNSTLVKAAAHQARRMGIAVLKMRAGDLRDWRIWVREITQDVKSAIRNHRPGLIFVGGEPRVGLPPRAGKGGRQTQIAAALILEIFDEISSGQVEIFCMSTDGTDGSSNSSGARLNAKVASAFTRSSDQAKLRRAIRQFNTASILRRAGALIPVAQTGTNLQDLVVIRVL